MKRFPIQTGAVASLLAAVAFAPMPALAQHRCDNPSGMIDKRACDKAAQGSNALRNFVSRTQTIWGLYYWDYARREGQNASTPTTVQTVPFAAAESNKAAVATNSR